MATRTAAKAAPRKTQATAKRAAAAGKPKATPSRKRATATRPGTARKPVTPKAASKKTTTSSATTAKRAPKAASPRRSSGSGAGKTRASRAPKPKAMEVSYSGRIFRSRLEARWAVFLDLLDVNWDYEPFFYLVGEELFYLADFYLPDQQLWLEVKGAPFMDTASMAKYLGAAGLMRTGACPHSHHPGRHNLGSTFWNDGYQTEALRRMQFRGTQLAGRRH